MIIPVRCFTCGKVISQEYEAFNEQYQSYKQDILEGKQPTKTPKDILDELGIDRYCCRRMIISHVDLLKEAAPYE